MRTTFSWRVMRKGDNLDQCLDIEPARLGDKLVGTSAARAAWRSLIGHPASFFVVFESQPALSPTVVGFGAAAFVTAAFASQEIASPSSGINDRFIASLTTGERPALLTRSQLALANATTGVDILLLYGGSERPGNPPDLVRVVMPMAFTHCVAGYRVRRLLWEAMGDKQIELAKAGGFQREVARFSEQHSVLTLTDATEAAKAPGTFAASYFRFEAPVLALTRGHQELLLAALSGITDAGIAAELGLTGAAVKSRWRSLLDHVSDVRPGLVEVGHETSVRGPQKRHLLIEYVRQHPEELRPYAH